MLGEKSNFREWVVMSLRAAIIGTGNIGTDLLLKARRSDGLKVTHFVGRRSSSPGIDRAKSLGIATLAGGVDDLMRIVDEIDVVFDATSARDHLVHDDLLKNTGLLLINLTPAKLGEFFVPNVTEHAFSGGFLNLNMVTCGGQTSIPLIQCVIDSITEGSRPDSVELVSTLASPSAGPATRLNIDEYVQNTKRAIEEITRVPAKVMLALNPAKPEIVMRSSIYFHFADKTPSFDALATAVNVANSNVRSYCAGYTASPEIVVIDSNTIKLTIEVESTSEFFPKYAGNLDIINTAAIRAAQAFDAHSKKVEK
jgi:acetaldehyde dehydrogenase